jgi:hypothetical protein
MNRAELASPIASAMPQAAIADGVPEITDVHYDLHLLRIALRFEQRNDPVQVQSHDTFGFRVLDEGDLSEFWSPESRPQGWLWQVTRGGWLDLERTRPTFLTGLNTSCSEYLVVGLNDCISVLATSDPVVSTP